MEPCNWCNQPHAGKCPLVKAFEFHPDGYSLKRVEFYAPNDYAPSIFANMPLPVPPGRNDIQIT